MDGFESLQITVAAIYDVPYDVVAKQDNSPTEPDQAKPSDVSVT